MPGQGKKGEAQNIQTRDGGNSLETDLRKRRQCESWDLRESNKVRISEGLIAVDLISLH